MEERAGNFFGVTFPTSKAKLANAFNISLSFINNKFGILTID